MSTLSINGIEVPAQIESLGMGGVESIGSQARSADGSMRIDRRGMKNSIDFAIPALTLDKARPWRSLLLGIGETWSYDTSLYGSKGSAGTIAGAVTRSSFGGYWGGCITPSNGSVTHAAVLPGPWTVIVANKEGASAWKRIAVRSDGAKWVDGVRNDETSTPWLTVATNYVRVSYVGTAIFDDLVVLPWLAPPEWLAIWSTLGAGPFSPLPKLNVTGDAASLGSPSGAMSCIGNVLGAGQFAASREGAWQPGNFNLSASLVEV